MIVDDYQYAMPYPERYMADHRTLEEILEEEDSWELAPPQEHGHSSYAHIKATTPVMHEFLNALQERKGEKKIPKQEWVMSDSNKWNTVRKLLAFNHSRWHFRTTQDLFFAMKNWKLFEKMNEEELDLGWDWV